MRKRLLGFTLLRLWVCGENKLRIAVGENARKRPPIMSVKSSVKGRLNLLGIVDGTKVNSAVRNKSFQTRK